MGHASALLFVLLQTPTPKPLDLRSLLSELVDRRALAELPAPRYRLRRARLENHSTGPEDSQRLDRSETVVADFEGPGAVVRIEASASASKLRVFLDGAESPVIVARTGGGTRTELPLCEETAHGWSFRLPIPFARRCRVECDGLGPLAGSVDVRAYPPETPVVSLAASDLERAKDAIERASVRWSQPGSGPDASGADTFAYTLSSENPEGVLMCVDPKNAGGPRAITTIHLRVEAPDLPLALRRALLRIAFDGEEAVLCPLGDFFASAPGLDPHVGWPFTVAPGGDEATGKPGTQGDFVCRFVMPYRDRFDLAIDGAGAGDLHVAGVVRTERWDWDERSLYFHARWRASGAQKMRPQLDWKPIRIEGRGVLVGEVLSIGNPRTSICEESGEIVADGETLLDRSRLDGRASSGWTSMRRFRALDAVPFESSLELRTSLHSSEECEVHVAATTFFYARPGVRDDTPGIRDADRVIPRIGREK